VASIGQFAVHPDWQAQGLGQVLMEHAERAAASIGAREVAVDTSENAVHLIRWYEHQGYRLMGNADWNVTNYRSVVLSKTLGGSRP
jgi:GNAT superfamily N-acetyltransferase